MSYSFTEKKRIRKSVCQARQRSRRSIPLGHPVEFVCAEFLQAEESPLRTATTRACNLPSTSVFPES